MHFLRRRLSRLVGAWLVCQLASAFLAPASLMAAGGSADICTCPGGMPGQTCPMHRNHEDTDGSRCAIGGLSADSDALLSLLGNIGVVPDLRSFALEPPVTVVRPPRVSPPLTRSDIPDPPPPRA